MYQDVEARASFAQRAKNALDRADLQTLQTVMTEAAEKPATIERLQRYKSARRVPVKKQVEKTRITYVDGWDSSSTDCANWYTSPVGCRATQPVATPYTESVMQSSWPNEPCRSRLSIPPQPSLEKFKNGVTGFAGNSTLRIGWVRSSASSAFWCGWTQMRPKWIPSSASPICWGHRIRADPPLAIPTHPWPLPCRPASAPRSKKLISCSK